MPRSLLTAFLLSSAALLAQIASPNADMLRADGVFVQAVAKTDKLSLEKLLDADFIWTNTAGQSRSRADFMSAIPTVSSSDAPNAASKGYSYGDLGNVQKNHERAQALRVWAKRATGWKLVVYQELTLRDAPPSFTPGAGGECDNPCKTIAFTPKTDTEREVAVAYSKLETAAHARSAAGFALMVAEEFVAASSNSDKLQTKPSRIAEFNRSKDGGVAPTPLLSGRMYAFGDAVLMISEHKPARGNPLHVTRIWVKRNGSWVETLSYQTSVTNTPAK